MPRKRLGYDDYKPDHNVSDSDIHSSFGKAPPMRIKLKKSVCDFSNWYGRGIDLVSKHIHKTLYDCLINETLTVTTVETYHQRLNATFIPFLMDISLVSKSSLTLTNIDINLMLSFIDWLNNVQANTKSGRLSASSKRRTYSTVKAVLKRLSIVRLIDPVEHIFPENPYYRESRRDTNSTKAYSKNEHTCILNALANDLRLWNQDKIKLTTLQILMIHLLLIAARSGRNTTPLIELSRDALQEHPIKKNRSILVTYKRRSNKTNIQSFKNVIETITTVRTDVVSLYNSALKITEPLLDKLPSNDHHRLWIYRSEGFSYRGEIKFLTEGSLHNTIHAWQSRHNFRADDGGKLSITISRLRKTFVNRVWELTGGNLLATALLSGHTAKVCDSSYLEAPPTAKRDFKWCGEAWVEHLRNNQHELPDSVVNTPVGHCTDSFYGKYSPKNGNDFCMNFLSCFHCPNQIVTGDDLWRLYSFYWLLIRERSFIPKNRWSKQYGYIIREIDSSIAIKFPTKLIEVNREKARTAPHPMWFDREALMSTSYTKEIK